MMYFLDKLWQGRIQPMDRAIRDGSRYQQLSKELGRELDVLTQVAPQEIRKLLEKIEKLSLDMTAIELEETYIQGFRCGAGVILDVIEEYPYQLCPIDEE